MNARDRIAEVLAHHVDSGDNTWLYYYADAVLAVLPDLLTDPDVETAATAAAWARQNYAPGALAHVVLRAAAQALTGDLP